MSMKKVFKLSKESQERAIYIGLLRHKTNVDAGIEEQIGSKEDPRIIHCRGACGELALRLYLFGDEGDFGDTSIRSTKTGSDKKQDLYHVLIDGTEVSIDVKTICSWNERYTPCLHVMPNKEIEKDRVVYNSTTFQTRKTGISELKRGYILLNMDIGKPHFTDVCLGKQVAPDELKIEFFGWIEATDLFDACEGTLSNLSSDYPNGNAWRFATTELSKVWGSFMRFWKTGIKPPRKDRKAKKIRSSSKKIKLS